MAQPARMMVAAMVAAGVPMAFGFTDATRAQVPGINIQQTCRAAADVVTSLTTARNYDHCLDSELKANARLVKEWDTFSGAHKLQCVRPTTYLPSYVELLTCLEMEAVAERLRNKAAPVAEVFTLPRPRPIGLSAVGSSEPPLAAAIVLPRPRPSVATIESNPPVRVRPTRHRRAVRPPPRSPAVSITVSIPRT